MGGPENQIPRSLGRLGMSGREVCTSLQLPEFCDEQVLAELSGSLSQATRMRRTSPFRAHPCFERVAAVKWRNEEKSQENKTSAACTTKEEKKKN